MNPRRLFVASCISLVASAFSFIMRQDVLPAWGRSFDLNAKELGLIGGIAFWGMATAMAIGSFIVDVLGMKRMLGLAFFCHLVGTLLMLGTPYLGGLGVSAYMLLLVANFLVGCANGLVEIGINPLAATLYPTKKTHMLNILHAWWPGGLMIGGLLALAISGVLGLQIGWRRGDAGGHDVRLAGQDGVDPGPDADLWGTVPVRAVPGDGARGLGREHPRDDVAGLAADVPALGLLHGADGRDRAGAPGDAEPRAGEDGGDERHLDPHLHQLADVRCCGTSPARSPTGSRRSVC